MKQVVLSQMPLGGAHCLRHWEACSRLRTPGQPGSGAGQAGHSSLVAGGLWPTLHTLTGSSWQALLGRRDSGAGRRQGALRP